MPNDPTGRYGIRFQVLRSLANREQLMMIDSALKPPMGTLWSPRCEQENEQIPRSWLTNSMKAVAVCNVVIVFFISVFFLLFFRVFSYLFFPLHSENHWKQVEVAGSVGFPFRSSPHLHPPQWFAPGAIDITYHWYPLGAKLRVHSLTVWLREWPVFPVKQWITYRGEWRSVAYGANREHGRVGRSSSSPRFTGRCALLFSDVHTMQLQIANPHLFHVVKCNRACNKWI